MGSARKDSDFFSSFAFLCGPARNSLRIHVPVLIGRSLPFSEISKNIFPP